MPATPWILLSSRLPREPSRLRLAVWRRLKRLGALLLHDSVWVLPGDAKTREAFEWLAEEIEEQGGTALLWEGASLSLEQDALLVQRFRSEADDRYAAIAESAQAIGRAALSSRKKAGAERRAQAIRQLRGLERALRLERRRDYFRAPGRPGAAAIVDAALRDVEATGAPSGQREVRHAVGH